MDKKRKVRIVRRYKPPVLPDRPPVDQGPKCYGRSKKKQYICIRFYLRHKEGRWWVVDLEGEKSYADETKAEGYKTKKAAAKIAKEYRDEYGAWGLVPF